MIKRIRIPITELIILVITGITSAIYTTQKTGPDISTDGIFTKMPSLVLGIMVFMVMIPSLIFANFYSDSEGKITNVVVRILIAGLIIIPLVLFPIPSAISEITDEKQNDTFKSVFIILLILSILVCITGVVSIIMNVSVSGLEYLLPLTVAILLFTTSILTFK